MKKYDEKKWHSINTPKSENLKHKEIIISIQIP